jgi:hypothetical protein
MAHAPGGAESKPEKRYLSVNRSSQTRAKRIAVAEQMAFKCGGHPSAGSSKLPRQITGSPRHSKHL